MSIRDCPLNRHWRINFRGKNLTQLSKNSNTVPTFSRCVSHPDMCTIRGVGIFLNMLLFFPSVPLYAQIAKWTLLKNSFVYPFSKRGSKNDPKNSKNGYNSKMVDFTAQCHFNTALGCKFCMLC